jgi:CubicO group peptidase (beta-lactamase class C family)
MVEVSRREFVEIAGFTILGLGLGCSRVESEETLDRFIESRLQDGAPGFAAAIVKGDRLVWAKGYGWANIGREIPMTPDTLMNIGSISKTVTATAVIQLWEAGKLGLDDDVNEHLPFAVRNPRFPDTPITFRQLLAHRSSITDGSAYGDSYACGDPTISLADWVRGYLVEGGEYFDAEENFHTWKPGTADPPARPRPYTNVGYGLLGYLVEVISETPFPKFCKARIFTPLGMEDTSWYIRDIDPKRHAVPYTWIADDFELPEGRTFESFLPQEGADPESIEPGTQFPHCLYSFPNYPDGLVRTSVRELSRFLTAYMNGGIFSGTRILEEDSVRTMLSDEHFGRGLCWSTRRLENGDRLWGHGGGDPGISTYMGFRPDDRVGVIVFYNGRPGAGAGEIFERLFREADAL